MEGVEVLLSILRDMWTTMFGLPVSTLDMVFGILSSIYGFFSSMGKITAVCTPRMQSHTIKRATAMRLLAILRNRVIADQIMPPAANSMPGIGAMIDKASTTTARIARLFF